MVKRWRSKRSSFERRETRDEGDPASTLRMEALELGLIGLVVGEVGELIWIMGRGGGFFCDWIAPLSYLIRALFACGLSHTQSNWLLLCCCCYSLFACGLSHTQSNWLLLCCCCYSYYNGRQEGDEEEEENPQPVRSFTSWDSSQRFEGRKRQSL